MEAKFGLAKEGGKRKCKGKDRENSKFMFAKETFGDEDAKGFPSVGLATRSRMARRGWVARRSCIHRES